MKILAIDTATEACSVALTDGNQRHSLFEICPREHTQRILPMISQLLDTVGIALAQLQIIAFGRGPGSFTGVRIAIATAQGLALGASVPVIGISTLAAMAEAAWQQHGSRRVLAAIDARMGEVYWAEYQRDEQGYWQGENSETLLTPQAVTLRLRQLAGEWAIVGTGWQSWPDLVTTTTEQGIPLVLHDAGIHYPAAADMLALAAQRYQQQGAVAVEHSEPVYLRNNVTWRKQNEK